MTCLFCRVRPVSLSQPAITMSSIKLLKNFFDIFKSDFSSFLKSTTKKSNKFDNNLLIRLSKA